MRTHVVTVEFHRTYVSAKGMFDHGYFLNKDNLVRHFDTQDEANTFMTAAMVLEDVSKITLSEIKEVRKFDEEG